MMHSQRWMTETLQRGGRFVFLQEGLPNLAEHFSGIVLVSAADLLSNVVATLPQDLIFIFESQFATLQSVDARLQGQRVLITSELVKKTHPWIEAGWVDVMMPDLDQAKWEGLFQLASTVAKRPLPDFRITKGQPCLFLDRDDVVVVNVPYNKDPEQVVLSAGIVNLINKAHAKNWWVALVTNQSGLGRGRITWEEYQKVHQRMLKLLAAEGAWIDECVWAAHIEEAPHAAGDFYASLRKPRPGMFQLVNDKLKVDLATSVMVGDSATDVLAATHAGIGTIYLLKTPRLEAEQSKLESMKAHVPHLQFKTTKDFDSVL